MIPRIKTIVAEPNWELLVTFDNGKTVLYDVEDDIKTIPDFQPLRTETGLFDNFQVDDSRTCVFWTDRIDLPSDTLLEYGKKVESKSKDSVPG